MRTLIATLLLAVSTAATAAAPPYDESADAKAQIQTALKAGQASKLPVLIVFGANWCADCKLLDAAFTTGDSAALIRQHFKVVKVNVGRFDRNVDVAETYGVPLKNGIPAVVVLSARGEPIYATRAGELADARSMGERGIHDFFAKVVSSRR